MADQWSGGQSGPGERWNVNLPAVIGVVFVFLVGVIAWVIVSSGRGDGEISTGSSVPTVTTGVATSVVQTTTPLPMPSTPSTPPTAPVTSPATVPATAAPTVPATAPPATAAPATAPPATAPPAPPPTAPPATQPPTTAAPTTTTAAPPPPVAEGGDLGVPGHPISRPPCNGGFITVLASAIGSQATSASMDAVLDSYSGSNYLRTDQTCSSLTPSSGGQPIYVVYYGPFGTDSEACAKRSDGPDDSYVRRLSNELSSTHSVDCD